ncbi:methylthioribose-1-phosphate isomerase [Aspergillus nomiae NRRL 13137]|uniref:Methylthioribose-1-phosphate isomerase n=1 Tax=Aspergillus nomiae NRRL (strain ATCC 15546 / NRRL 13137 / CBS 260.88 / M93) TaxID=1509407 RepID=A0A0L1J310_ASPN3|nr:methylthioribose-1-phosphate isomerase [Aspergillus nomiae NRRL 13137]KNG86045.1 methylthioribose-1-phosphate isomerase [Aspergillus nomiae NRRL 13137]
MTLQAIKYNGGNLAIIDQLQLPHVEKYVTIHTSEEGWHAIKEMRVRGAPAIAIVAALSLASELTTLMACNKLSSNAMEAQTFITEKLHYLVSSRPTAVNLSDAAGKLETIVAESVRMSGSTGHAVATAFIQAAEAMLVKDVEDNRKIGEYGAKWISENALSENGTKATFSRDFGVRDSLGVIRALHSTKTLQHAYCTETRPYNQGSRLTAFELVHDCIPATLITDSMAAALLARPEIGVNAIVVGADRVAANGDTANKIGTYGLAVLAKHHGVKFLVAAPLTTIDLVTKSGNEITIEERPASEVTRIRGTCEDGGVSEAVKMETVCIAAKGINVWNPAFDITPGALIDGIITEKGVVEKDSDGLFHLEELFKA